MSKRTAKVAKKGHRTKQFCAQFLTLIFVGRLIFYTPFLHLHDTQHHTVSGCYEIFFVSVFY